ncbi:acyl-CoA-binding protein [Cupriavidus sp. BIC8F]|uniref:acyl-CoA-binding protein n=1 Tax=Cupriavidus sp. BIC8F TaxID=3079014 RepID=UPI00291657EE|nr:acyl-CoA-binding protein [Cupriavidus sp. BIC8F]
MVHARLDELTSLRSANYLVEQIGQGKRAGQARMLVLEDSYHMVCVDNDRELVARSVLEFFEASVPISLGMPSDDARMSPAQMTELLAAARADLERGDFGVLYARGKGDFAWFQPGSNRASGRALPRLRAWADTGVAFTAFGAPVLNTGMAVVPATLRSGTLASQGVLAFALRDGKLLEGRWFPDEIALEDAHFGGVPTAQGPGPAKQAFEAAAALSKTLRHAPGNDTLLDLYALYKQGSVGDVSGERPGMMDMVGRAKNDAWAARRGLAREQAMRDYVALVNQLKSAETQSA